MLVYQRVFFNFTSDLMSGWWIIGIQPDLLVFAANSTHPLLFLQVVEHLWITGSPHIDNLTESTSIGSRWIHVVGWNHVRGGKLLGMPSGYAQFWESMVNLPAPMFLFWWFFCPIFWWVVSNDILTASTIPSSFIHGNYWSDGEGCQNASSLPELLHGFKGWNPWLQRISFRLPTVSRRHFPPLDGTSDASWADCWCSHQPPGFSSRIFFPLVEGNYGTLGVSWLPGTPSYPLVI